jgi:uncharacterized protein YodC (DUF2158 family)
MENTIKVGDVVVLKSDTAQKMTIGKLKVDNECECYYWINGEIKHSIIPEEALKKIR